LLIEGESTNILLYSQDFSQSAWIKARSSITTGITAPDGTATACKIVSDTTANASHYVYQKKTDFNSAGETWGISIFAKAAELKKIRIFTRYDNNLYADFDLETGECSGKSGAQVATFKLNDGWFRCSVSYTFPTAGEDEICFFPCDDNGSINFDGDGVSGVYIWQAQLEKMPFATSPILTTNTEVTRAKDVVVVDHYNNTPPYPENDCAFAFEYDVLGYNDASYNVFFEQGWNINRFFFLYATNRVSFYSGGDGAVYYYVSNFLANKLVFNLNDTCSIWINGEKKSEGDSITYAHPNNTNKLALGQYGSLTHHLFGHLKDFRIYDFHLTDEEIQLLHGGD
jgi:hypothetical protein